MTDTTVIVSELNYILMLKVIKYRIILKKQSLLIKDLNMMTNLDMVTNNYEVVQNIIYPSGWNLFREMGPFP